MCVCVCEGGDARTRVCVRPRTQSLSLSPTWHARPHPGVERPPPRLLRRRRQRQRLVAHEVLPLRRGEATELRRHRGAHGGVHAVRAHQQVVALHHQRVRGGRGGRPARARRRARGRRGVSREDARLVCARMCVCVLCAGVCLRLRAHVSRARALAPFGLAAFALLAASADRKGEAPR